MGYSCDFSSYSDSLRAWMSTDHTNKPGVNPAIGKPGTNKDGFIVDMVAFNNKNEYLYQKYKEKVGIDSYLTRVTETAKGPKMEINTEVVDTIEGRLNDILSLEEAFSPETLEKQEYVTLATELIKKFSKAFNTPYEIISEERAAEILKAKGLEYKGEAGFYVGQGIYLVSGKITTDTVLHEFGHVLIAGIKLNNRELYNKLVEELKSTKTGIQLIEAINQEYPELQGDTDRIIEEALVTALEYNSMATIKEMEADDPGFANFFRKLIAQVRKLFRRLIPNLKAEKLDSNTSLKKLSELMVKDTIDVFIPKNLRGEFVQFKKNLEELNKQLADRIGSEKLINIIDDTYLEMTFQLNNLKDSPWILSQALKKAKAESFLNAVKSQLEPFQKAKHLDKISDEDIVEALGKHESENYTRLLALVNSLNDVNQFVDTIEMVLKGTEIDNVSNSLLAIQQVMYFEGFLKRQVEFIEELKKGTKLQDDNEFSNMLNTIDNKAKANLNRTKDLKTEFVTMFFVEQSKEMKTSVEGLLKEKLKSVFQQNKISEAKAAEIIEKIINLEKGVEYTLADVGLENIDDASGKVATDTIKRFLAKRLDEQTIEDFISGKRGDIDFLQAWAVPYSNIDDPITGNVIMWIRKIQSDAEQETLRTSTDFGNKVIKHLKALNWSPDKTTMLADLLLTKDTIGTYDRAGKFIKQEIYSFLDTHVNWRGDYAELKDNLDKATESNDPDKVTEAYDALQTWKDKYLHGQYKPEYKNLQKIWSQDNIVVDPFTNKSMTVSAKLSTDARAEKIMAFNKMRLHQEKAFKESEDTVDYTTEELTKTEYKELFAIHNPDGTPKTGEELQKVLVRLKYKKESSKFYEYLPMNNVLQEDFGTYLRNLRADNITEELDKEAYDAAIKKFERRYMRKSYSDKYYEDTKNIFEKINEITAKYADQYPELQERTLLIARRNAIINKDNFGTPEGSSMSIEMTKEVLAIDKKIEELSKAVNIQTGLTSDEHIEFNDIKYKYQKNSGKLTPAEIARYAELKDKVDLKGMSPEDAIAYKEYWKRYSEQSQKLPTDYYFDAFLFAIGDVEVDPITKDNYDDYINDGDIILKAIDENPSFKTWFTNNHYQREVWSGKERVKKWFRTSQWNQSIPLDPAHIQTTELKDPFTGKTITLQGVPGNKYMFTKVKKEFLTVPYEDSKSQIGTIIDNKGNFLPRAYKPGDELSAADDKYVNKEYEALKSKGGDRYELLKAFKEQTLASQENTPSSAKLYYDFPRRRLRGNLESLQRGATQEKYKATFKDVVFAMNPRNKKNLQADASSFGFNYSLETQLVTTDMQGDAISRIPVQGLSNIPIAETSVDVLSSFYDYIHSINLAKHKHKSEPVSRAIMDVIGDKDNAIKDMSKASKQIWLNHKSYQYLKKTDNRRLQALDTLMDRFFYGEMTGSFEGENPITTRLVNGMMGAASRSFIALDIPSAVKNRWGMIFQNHIEAAGGQYVDFKSLAQGRARSVKNIWELSSKGIYSIADRPLDVMVMESFDPMPGKTEKGFGKNASRSMMKDFFDMTWLYDFRRLAEVEASLQVFWGMMYKKEIEQLLPNGEVKKIKYADAWTKDDKGQLILKPGINPEYGNKPVDHLVVESDTVESIAKQYNIPQEKLREKNNLKKGEEFKLGDLISISNNELFSKFKFQVQGVGKRLNGLVGEMDNPQGNKLMGYRLFTFYKKFATGMFLNRYQADMDKDNRFGHVYDFEMSDMTRGYTVAGISAMAKLIKTGGKYYPHMTTEEKVAWKKMLAEGAQIALVAMAITMLFGYDMGDEDRFKKLAKREEKYGTWGWLGNHMLYQLMMVNQENEAFTPYLGASQFLSYTDKVTIATGPTVQLYAKILYDLGRMATGDDKARYKADVGPYPWQKEGNYKLWHHAFSLFGVKGKTYVPAHAIRLAEMFENLK
jgi:hypothetical protein